MTNAEAFVLEPPRQIERGALFSPCRRWRYKLIRSWGFGHGVALWVLLNPSIADAYRDDPTTTYCVNRTILWGMQFYIACNLFAIVGTNPAILRTAPDPIGPANDQHIADAASEADRIVVAWGSNPSIGDRAEAVAAILRASRKPIYALGVNADGSPRFPRAVPHNTPLRRFLI